MDASVFLDKPTYHQDARFEATKMKVWGTQLGKLSNKTGIYITNNNDIIECDSKGAYPQLMAIQKGI